ncbi:MAG: hypothetical protein QOF73_4913 [Thermomicrobiales bacterium]|jgi:hypothetical protein|nr:hypothetical protein [Thermomicrobiales bacterium]
MDTVLKGLFGGGGETGPANEDQARDFVNRYEQGDPTEGYSSDEAMQYFGEVAQHASPDQMEQAMRESMSRLNPNQRQEFAQMLQQRMGGQVQRPMADQDPNDLDGFMGGLGQMFGGGGGGGGLGGLLGGLLGGGMTGSSNAGSMFGGGRSSNDGGGGGAGGLGDIVGSPIGRAVLAGAAAFAMKQMFGRR